MRKKENPKAPDLCPTTIGMFLLKQVRKKKKAYLDSLANASTIYENFEFETLTNPKYRNRNRLFGFKISQKAIKPITALSIIRLIT